KMKIAIVEDEDIFARKLWELLENFFKVSRIETEIKRFDDSSPLLEETESGEKYELIFFDIQLKNSDGMEAAGKLRELGCGGDIIFVTGAEDRAAEGYEVDAFDFIAKSKLDERLETVLKRYLKRLGEGSLYIPSADGGSAVIPFREIYAAESRGRRTVIHTVTGKLETNTAVGKIAESLPKGRYFEVHKGVYVRLEEIRSVDRDRLKMRDGSFFPVSRRQRKPLMEELLRTCG
ncbi:MAG: LytTR family DNA-binding domain-containing protein, partial [Ruminococcus sp.]|nr:LytTR family DNA-binding domain-containing protein [Ruminococcus sp.]